MTLIFTVTHAEIVTYPAPPGLTTSPDFTVMADSQQVWVERIGSKLPAFDYNLYGSRETGGPKCANFSCSGTVTISNKDKCKY